MLCFLPLLCPTPMYLSLEHEDRFEGILQRFEFFTKGWKDSISWGLRYVLLTDISNKLLAVYYQCMFRKAFSDTFCLTWPSFTGKWGNSADYK